MGSGGSKSTPSTPQPDENARDMSSTVPKGPARKVCVVGGGGGIGQPLSLLLKLDPNVGHVSVFDLCGAPGVAADIGHIDTPATVSGHGMTPEQFRGDKAMPKEEQDAFQAKAFLEALEGSEVVIIPAGMPRRPGMTRQDLFKINAGLVCGFAEAISKACPKAMVAIVTNPVNSTVPIFAEKMKKLGCYDAKRIFGVSSLDLVRSRTFLSAKCGHDVTKFTIPVIGGHSGVTILPVLSQAQPPVKDKLSDEEITAITERIQNAGTEVVIAKAGAGSATLSMAKAGAGFVNSLIRGMNGEEGVVECAYVESDVHPDCKWFATPLLLGPNGIEKNMGIGNLDDFEKKLMEKVVEALVPNITDGVEFVANEGAPKEDAPQEEAKTVKVVMVRHGESEWNALNQFCGWFDAALSEKGKEEAAAGGKALKDAGYTFDAAHSSVLQRANTTCETILEALDLKGKIPFNKTWRLNERHYGGLTGLNKKETAEKYGEEQVLIWRRSFDVPPLEMTEENEYYTNIQKDERYADVPEGMLPVAESLKLTIERTLPYWNDSIVPELKAGKKLLIAAHGNSLRGIVKMLDDLTAEQIMGIDLPTGIPFEYELSLPDLKPVVSMKFLGDEETVAKAIAKVKKQGKK